VSPAVRLVWDIGAQLGEGPVWCPDGQALWFVDIKGGAIHRHVPGTGACKTHVVGGVPSFIVPAEVGGMIVGSGNGVYRLENDRIGKQIAAIDMPAHNRTNDATVDALGRLWFGTMDDYEQRSTGALHCLNRGVLRCMGGEAVVTNGPAISYDGSTLYFVDSGNRTIWRYAIGDGPVIEDGEVFLQLGEADGHPDGVVLDSEDCLWVALWDGWGVRRYAPDGRLLLHVDLPCSRVTKIAFGGPDLRTAYVTTARTGLDAMQLDHQLSVGGCLPSRLRWRAGPCRNIAMTFDVSSQAE
jgi:xylono-1,5-lactonase